MRMKDLPLSAIKGEGMEPSCTASISGPTGHSRLAGKNALPEGGSARATSWHKTI
jgi:hypothetical protein